MPDLEKVIKGLEWILQDDKFGFGENWDSGEPQCDEEKAGKIIQDALSLLKAQEPVEPYMDYDGQDVWRWCGSCGAILFHLSHTQADEDEQKFVKFCRHCGKAVKWE